VCDGRGFAWVMNALRVSDIYLTHAVKLAYCMELMSAFRNEIDLCCAIFDAVIKPLSIKTSRNHKAGSLLKLRQGSSPNMPFMNAEMSCMQNAMFLWTILQFIDLPQVKEPGSSS
jgi:hypothetical protein